MRVFIDTNLWVYRLDKRDQAKSRRIGTWLREMARDHEIVVSTQVLIELRSVLTRKLTPPLSAHDTRIALNAVATFEVLATSANLVLDAHELAAQQQLSWFDALIVEAAIRSRCSVLFSEDFTHGQQIAGLEICNPLLDTTRDSESS